MPSYTFSIKEVLEWISGIAMAECCKLCEELAFTNEKHIREACTWAANTSMKCYEESHSKIRRMRRHSFGNTRKQHEYYNSRYLQGQADTQYGGYGGYYDDYGSGYGYNDPTYMDPFMPYQQPFPMNQMYQPPPLPPQPMMPMPGPMPNMNMNMNMMGMPHSMTMPQFPHPWYY